LKESPGPSFMRVLMVLKCSGMKGSLPVHPLFTPTLHSVPLVFSSRTLATIEDKKGITL
jgi:hypothetical protein